MECTVTKLSVEISNEEKDKHLPDVKCKNIHMASPHTLCLCKMIQKKVNEHVGYDLYDKEYGEGFKSKPEFTEVTKPEIKLTQMDVKYPREIKEKVNVGNVNVGDVKSDGKSKISLEINVNFNVK